MTHARKKLTLSLVRAISLGFGFTESSFDSQSLCDVVRYTENGLVSLRPGRRPQHIDQGTVFANVAVNKVGHFSSDL
jgi:hypothetical protein